MCKKELEEISREYPFRRSLYINYHDIESFGKTGTQMADELLENPGKVIADIRDAIKNHRLVKVKKEKDPPDINVRFLSLPRKIAIREIRSDHIGRFISVEGILRKITEVRPRITLAVFRCPSGHRTVKAQGYGPFIEPDGCSADGCTQKKLELIPRFSRFVDSQKYETGQRSEATEILEHSLRFARNDPAALSRLGDAWRDLEDFCRADELYARSLELDPEDGEVWCNRGCVLMNTDNIQEALHCFDQALTLNPGDARAGAGRDTCLTILNLDLSPVSGPSES